MNKVILIGRVTKDPEVRYTQNNKAVASFTVATDRRSKGSEKKADFINCVAWEKTAEIISKYAPKGKQIMVEGSLQTRSYDAQDGSKRYVTEVLVNNVELLGGRENNNGGNAFGIATDDDIPF